MTVGYKWQSPEQDQMSPVFRNSAELGQGAKDLGGQNLRPDAAANSITPSRNEIAQAHQFFKPAIDGGALSAAHAVNPLMAAGHETISPIIQLIMRMPGHIGLFNSFFEALGNFLAPHLDLLSQFGFDPNLLAQHAHSAAESLIPSPEHAMIDPSLLPDQAPILSELGHHASIAHTQLHETTLISSETFKPLSSNTSLEVSGQLDLSKPQYEGGSSIQGSLISGPAMSDANYSVHLASAQRLMSDSSQMQLNSQLAQAGNASNGAASSNFASNSYLSIASNPSATTSSLNVGGSIMGDQSQSVANQLSDTSAVSNNVSMNLVSPHSETIALAHTDMPSTLQGSSAGSTASVADSGSGIMDGKQLVGLKAKALSLDSLVGKSGSSHFSAGHGSNQYIAQANVHPKLSSSTSGQSQQLPGHKSISEVAATHQTSVEAAHKQVATSSFDPYKNAFESKVAAPTHHSITHHLTAKPVQKAAESSVSAPASTSSYTIKSGDCLWNIAQDKLHSAVRWQEIYKLNENVLGANPGALRVGTTIQLPDANVSATPSVQYTVRPGDNLWTISKEFLGDGLKWHQIYQMNHDMIGTNPSVIVPGQHLTVHAADTTLSTKLPTGDVTASATPASDGQFVGLDQKAIPAHVDTTPKHLLSGAGGAEAASITQSNQAAAANSTSTPATQATHKPSIVSSKLLSDLSSFLKKK